MSSEIQKPLASILVHPGIRLGSNDVSSKMRGYILIYTPYHSDVDNVVLLTGLLGQSLG